MTRIALEQSLAVCGKGLCLFVQQFAGRSLSQSLILIALLIFLFAVQAAAAPPSDLTLGVECCADVREPILQRLMDVSPHYWGERAPGVLTAVDTDQPLAAITLDACSAKNNNSYDEALIKFLEAEQIPASLFVSGRWIARNADRLKVLAANPLFEIENHGQNHRPCSVKGRGVYGLQGTHSTAEVIDEIEINARRIEEITGKRPSFYRAAGAFSDEVCPQIAAALGEQMVSYSVAGDGGAKFSAEEAKRVLSRASSGAIILLHFNHPEQGNIEGVKAGLAELRKRGMVFVRLKDVKLK